MIEFGCEKMLSGGILLLKIKVNTFETALECSIDKMHRCGMFSMETILGSAIFLKLQLVWIAKMCKAAI